MPTLSRFGSHLIFRYALLLIVGLLSCAVANGQRIRIPDAPYHNAQFPASSPTQFSTLPPIQTPTLPGSNPAVVSPPLMQLPPGSPMTGTAPPIGFDAYGGAGAPAPVTTWPQDPAASGAMIYPPANSYPWVGGDPG